MFKSLKDKLKGWISRTKEETEEELVESVKDDEVVEDSVKKDGLKADSKQEKENSKKKGKEGSKEVGKGKNDSKDEKEAKKVEEGVDSEKKVISKDEKKEKKVEEKGDLKKEEKKGVRDDKGIEGRGEFVDDDLEKIASEKKGVKYIDSSTKFSVGLQNLEADVEESIEKLEEKEAKDEELDAEKSVKSDKKSVEQLSDKDDSSEMEESLNEEIKIQGVDSEKKGFFASLFGSRKKQEDVVEEVKDLDKGKKEGVDEENVEEVVEEKVEEVLDKEKGDEVLDGKKEDLDVVKGGEGVIKEKKRGFSFFRKALTEEKFEELFEELELILLQNNVAYDAIEKIKESLKDKLVGESSNVDIESALKESIKELLINPPDIIEEIRVKGEGPFVILFAGINGSGKTTTIAKLANLILKNDFSVCLASADTFRAAAIEQLQVHADRLKVPLIKKDYGSDPASVGFDAVKYAKKHKIDVVLIDSAGRMNNRDSLMREIEKIARVNSPDLKIFLGESITGNDATEQARDFNDAIKIDGIILSKADVDEKGGTAISVAQVTKKPIYFLGTGQGYDDIERFDKDKLIEKIFS